MCVARDTPRKKRLHWTDARIDRAKVVFFHRQRLVALNLVFRAVRRRKKKERGRYLKITLGVLFLQAPLLRGKRVSFWFFYLFWNFNFKSSLTHFVIAFLHSVRLPRTFVVRLPSKFSFVPWRDAEVRDLRTGVAPRCSQRVDLFFFSYFSVAETRESVPGDKTKGGRGKRARVHACPKERSPRILVVLSFGRFSSGNSETSCVCLCQSGTRVTLRSQITKKNSPL